MTQFDPEVVKALAYLRLHVQVDARASVKLAFDALDNAGVFAALDEQVDYAQAEDILAESAAMAATAHTNIPPAEALQVLHNTWDRRDGHGHRVMVQPLTGSAPVAARRLSAEESAALRVSPPIDNSGRDANGFPLGMLSRVTDLAGESAIRRDPSADAMAATWESPEPPADDLSKVARFIEELRPKGRPVDPDGR
jgi:hypothetical protein